MEAVTIGQISTVSSLTTSDYIEIEQNGVSKKATLSALTAIIPTPAADQIRGYIDGLICSNAADTEHDISIAAGVAADSTNGYWLELSSALVKQIDASWAAGTNAGGLDTGSVATASTYYIWLIRKDDDESIDALFSLSKTAPTMPAGYTYKRRIMSIKTDSSANVISFIQKDNRVFLKDPLENRNYATALLGTTRTAYDTSAPPSMAAVLSIKCWNAATAGNYFLWWGNEGRTDTAASASNFDAFLYLQSAILTIESIIYVNSSSQFYARGNSTNIRFGYFTLGWIDDRGTNV